MILTFVVYRGRKFTGPINWNESLSECPCQQVVSFIFLVNAPGLILVAHQTAVNVLLLTGASQHFNYYSHWSKCKGNMLSLFSVTLHGIISIFNIKNSKTFHRWKYVLQTHEVMKMKMKWPPKSSTCLHIESLMPKMWYLTWWLNIETSLMTRRKEEAPWTNTLGGCHCSLVSMPSWGHEWHMIFSLGTSCGRMSFLLLEQRWTVQLWSVWRNLVCCWSMLQIQ